ncbi:MAG: TrkH family potassium uptake protein [Clostridia bacterium]|nr:TrkH family potassium uptake protein [Clostridia bacterium]
MNKRLILRLIGRLLLMEAALMVPSLIVSLIYGQGDWLAFVETMGITGVCGALLAFLVKPERKDLNPKDGLAVAGLSWIILSFFGCLPFWLSGKIPTLTDAYFETVSGFTTTGASILTNIEGMPRGLLFWRSFTHWIGGMGVLVLTVALLPRLSGRTAQLTKAESPGPVFSKLLPRTSDTAKMLYLLYFLLSFTLFVALLIAGMNVYDALIHTFSTAGTGGFSSYNNSVGAFGSPAIEWIIGVFMMLFGVNFTMYFYLLRKEVKPVLKNEELRVYLGIVLTATLCITFTVLPQFPNFHDAIRASFFQTASIISTTGFITADFDVWPIIAKTIIICLMVIGGCAGSTGGGFKVSRVIMLVKDAIRDIKVAIHPRKVAVVRMDGKPVQENVIISVGGFLFLYVMLELCGALLLSLDHIGMGEAFTAALTCISNVGPGMGAVGPTQNFSLLSPFSKWICSFLMLAGRLEFIPILSLFSIGLWRKKG